MNRTRIARALASEEAGGRITVMGWIRTKRDSKGGFSFLELNDGSCFDSLQVIVDKKISNYEEEILKLQTGCSVQVQGILTESPGKGQKMELHAFLLSMVDLRASGRHFLSGASINDR